MRVGTSMTDVVGGTPVVQLSKVVPPDGADLFVKLEWFNPTGSVVDEFTIERTESGTTRLVGMIRDSSHLNGLLAHFTALTVELVGLHRLDDPSGGASADRDPHPERQQP